MSSNPFRKKALGPIDTARASSPRSSLRSEDAEAGDRKNKPVKRVRVLSPPPLSPDSPEWPFDAPQPPVPLSDDTYNHSNYYPSFDPFNGASTDESDGESLATPPADKYQHQPQQQQQQQQHDARSGGIPANPFSKTLRDLEGSKDLQRERKEEGEVLKAANEGRKSLNVDSFKRLLMTGNADDSASSASTDGEEETAKGNALTTAQTNARDRNYTDSGSLADSSHDDEDKEESKILAVKLPASKEKKAPPPPPSSRHGKSLRQREPKDVKDDGHATAEPVRRSMDDDEPRLDTQATNAAGGEADARPQINSIPNFPGARKPAPAPPPPRGHARTDSKSHDNETPPRRTSSEDMPSRSDSTRSAGHAPAPPPPRRPYLAPKQSSSSSPSTSSSNMASSTDHVQDIARSSHDSPTPSKPLIAPPPPPTRQPSTRRPPSVTGVDAPSRRVSSENKSRDTVPPPPPPPRHRGSSPNADGRKVSGEAHAADPSKSADILADLDALQREVDALRGQMK
ncbi:hypothetical protein MGU_01736 [Metarhizium guizhouense ARSEF 977]|uniref:Uncharacterized protein n=1 Tax=Metarhizium guizhouense (strain ARSEF 977) TaxID=1276136 RepID=A0A0B4HNY8_METGA|nr:hypothetical protein MGU_01736 [Metarhizium guizhouense ARSEF 977]